ncbi:MAG: hypothetical protein ACXWXS_02915, partial [Actinomycetota bacterium]
MRAGAIFRLLRFPGLWVAVASAALVLGVVSAAGELFLDATGSMTLHRSVSADAEYRLPTVAIVGDSSPLADVLAYRTDLVEAELGDTLGEPILTARGDLVTVGAGKRQVSVRIVTRTGALQHVEHGGDDATPGVWLASVTADQLQVGAGDAIVVSGSRASTEVTVAGIYRDLLEQPRTPFWASLDTFIYTSPGANTRPPALMLMNLETYAALEDRLLD